MKVINTGLRIASTAFAMTFDPKALQIVQPRGSVRASRPYAGPLNLNAKGCRGMVMCPSKQPEMPAVTSGSTKLWQTVILFSKDAAVTCCCQVHPYLDKFTILAMVFLGSDGHPCVASGSDVLGDRSVRSFRDLDGVRLTAVDPQQANATRAFASAASST